MVRSDSKAAGRPTHRRLCLRPLTPYRAPKSLTRHRQGLSSLVVLGFPKPDLARSRSWNGFFATVASSEQKNMQISESGETTEATEAAGPIHILRWIM